MDGMGHLEETLSPTRAHQGQGDRVTAAAMALLPSGAARAAHVPCTCVCWGTGAGSALPVTHCTGTSQGSSGSPKSRQFLQS